MADSSSRRGSLRLPRVRGHNSSAIANSRNSSIRSSAAFDDARQSSAVHSLRAASSRFSLNQEFASTRQEYELWDDDSSSIFERGTNASDAGDTEGERILVRSAEDLGLLYSPDAMASASQMPNWDYYDILCLSRDTDLSQDQIRRAYYRLFLLFYPDSYPEHLRPIARQQFLRAQEAFEALIDPTRRAQYDVAQLLPDDRLLDTKAYDAAFEEAVRDRLQSGIHTSSDLGIRLDATRPVGQPSGTSWQTWGSPLRLLDFAFSHSVSVGIPALQKTLQPRVTRLERLTTAKQLDGELFGPTVELATPTVTVSGSVYGVAEDLSLLPTALFFDQYQPLLPLTIPRARLIQLVEHKLSPLVTLKFRQEILNRSPPAAPDSFRWVKSAVELDSDILPEPHITGRVYHHITLPNTLEPTIIEASIKSSRHNPRTPPRLALGLHQNLYHGTAFFRADSGDWTLLPGEASRFFTDFARMNPSMFSAEFPFKTSPSLEAGFRTSERASISSSSDLNNSENGIRGLDYEMDSPHKSSWAVSAAATPTSIAGFVRYSRDLSLPLKTPELASPASARLEVELCSNTFQDRYLALRNLWSVGRFARLGLEVGISMHNLHLSLYWSRLGQRISLPLLIAPRALFTPGVLLWAAALPFASLAAFQLFLQHRRTTKPDGPRAAGQISIARHRYEADNLTVLLAQPVEARQKRQMARGGLVILSAKFGIPDEKGTWTGSEVADVTIALAALIDEAGRVVVPRGVRKGRIPGFWDPVPGKEKTLHVQYSWKGVEAVVDILGREELVLPPQS
ncbi:hypothetical protein G7046_g5367 [Stylonectria norvegica]|nr:hypothetical protein G7046_g5367 [Stylonectria norvegica]